jgi:hypothetical protein
MKKTILKASDHHCECPSKAHIGGGQCFVRTNKNSYFVANKNTTEFNGKSVNVLCTECMKFHSHHLSIPIHTKEITPP